MVLALEHDDCQKWRVHASKPLEDVRDLGPGRRGRDLEMGQKCFH